MQWYVKFWIACIDIYGMWLSLIRIRIRIHCLQSPMKFKLACIPRSTELHIAQSRITCMCWKWFFMRKNDDKTFSFLGCWLFSLHFISHKSIKCVQLFYWIYFFCSIFSFSSNQQNILNFFFSYSYWTVCFSYVFFFFYLPRRQVIHPDRSDRWTLQIKFPQLRDSGVYGKKKNRNIL